MPGRAEHEKKKRLSRGREIKSARALILRHLRQGDIHIKDVLNDPPDALGTYFIYRLLSDAPKLGDTGMRKVLETAEVHPLAIVGELTPEERTALYDALPERVKNFDG